MGEWGGRIGTAARQDEFSRIAALRSEVGLALALRACVRVVWFWLWLRTGLFAGMASGFAQGLFLLFFL